MAWKLDHNEGARWRLDILTSANEILSPANTHTRASTDTIERVFVCPYAHARSLSIPNSLEFM